MAQNQASLEHTVLKLWLSEKPKPVLDYVYPVNSDYGPNHIERIFEENYVLKKFDFFFR